MDSLSPSIKIDRQRQVYSVWPCRRKRRADGPWAHCRPQVKGMRRFSTREPCLTPSTGHIFGRAVRSEDRLEFPLMGCWCWRYMFNSASINGSTPASCCPSTVTPCSSHENIPGNVRVPSSTSSGSSRDSTDTSPLVQSSRFSLLSGAAN